MFTKKAVLLFMSISTWVAIAHAGAVSGGGGGSLQGSPVEPRVLREAIFDSRILIEAFLNHMSTKITLEDTGATDYPHKAFRQFFVKGALLPEMLSSIRLVIDEQNPCLDFNGQLVDASIKTDIPNGICVSLPRLHEKLRTSNFEVEIGALILHEISHLLGSHEEEAVGIQMTMLETVRGQDSAMIRSWVAQAVQTLRSLDAHSALVTDGLRSNHPINCYSLRSFSVSHIQTINQLTKSSLSLLNEISIELLIQAAFRVQAATDYLCSLNLDPGNISMALPAAQRYKDGFGGQTEVSVDSYERLSTHNLSTFDRFPLRKLRIKQLTSVEMAARDIDQTSRPLSFVGIQLEDQFKLRFRSL